MAPAENGLYSTQDVTRRGQEPGSETPLSERFPTEFRRDYARVIHCASFRRLQGKTQLFPSNETDFFRNRLTHSLEVAQIASGIAHKLNQKVEFFQAHQIDHDLVQVAGLVHDIGHPPFGHNGERALDEMMREHGGFEGNAQTIRVLTKLEKKFAIAAEPLGVDDDGTDYRCGLNLTFRTIASALKYDQEIELNRNSGKELVKGYYSADRDIIELVKKHVPTTDGETAGFKTIECAIMDVADDIAYSTYDLEDAFKGGFLTPIEIHASGDELIERVAIKCRKKFREFSGVDVQKVLQDLFPIERLDDASAEGLGIAAASTMPYLESKLLASNGYYRTQFTAGLVSRFMEGVAVEVNEANPAFSKLFLDPEIERQIEVLKNFNYEATIMSTRLRVTERRGDDLVKRLFEAIIGDDGYKLLPDDYRLIYQNFSSETDRRRVVADYIAGMTDRYAAELYGRIFGENYHTIFKPT